MSSVKPFADYERTILQQSGKSDELIRRQFFSAHRRVQSETCDRGIDAGFVIACRRKAVDKRFTTHGERRADYFRDLFVDTVLLDVDMNDRAVHVRRGSKHLPSDCARNARFADKLRADREHAVIFSARGRDNALGDFFLHHDRNAFASGLFEKSEEDGRSDVIREIGYRFEFIRAEFGKIAFHEIRKYHRQIRELRFERSEIILEPFVDLESDHARASFRQRSGKRALPGADFDNGIRRRNARVRDDSRKQIAVGQEVLTERMRMSECVHVYIIHHFTAASQPEEGIKSDSLVKSPTAMETLLT